MFTITHSGTLQAVWSDRRGWGTACVGELRQLYSANNEFLLGFCMLMDKTESEPKWLVNMHSFWQEAERCPAGFCWGRRSEQKWAKREGKQKCYCQWLVSVCVWSGSSMIDISTELQGRKVKRLILPTLLNFAEDLARAWLHSLNQTKPVLWKSTYLLLSSVAALVKNHNRFNRTPPNLLPLPFFDIQSAALLLLPPIPVCFPPHHV